jgi:putative endonuclease
MPFYLYILQSESTNRFYIGQTKDLRKRFACHNANYSKSLKNRGPWRLVYTEEYATHSQAVRREKQIKSWKDREMIERLIECARCVSPNLDI